MLRHLLVLIFIHIECISVQCFQAGVVRPDGSLRNDAWYSGIYNRECKSSCAASQGNSTDIRLQNVCPLRCQSGYIAKQTWKNHSYRKFPVQMASTGQRSECWIGVLSETLSCHKLSTTRTQPGIPAPSCQAINYRYFLPTKQCGYITADNYEEGRETCREACIGRDPSVVVEIGGKAMYRILVDVDRMRSIFHVCYSGKGPENDRRGSNSAFRKFCRADLQSCRQCFRWGHWKNTTNCRCNGTITMERDCEIRADTTVGTNIRWSYRKVSTSYCEAYFGDNSTETRNCVSATDCAQWEAWSTWTGCRKLPAKSPCRRKRSGVTYDILIEDERSNQTDPITITLNAHAQSLSMAASEGKISMIEKRSRVCSGNNNNSCVGDSIQTRPIVCPKPVVIANECGGEKSDVIEKEVFVKQTSPPTGAYATDPYPVKTTLSSKEPSTHPTAKISTSTENDEMKPEDIHSFYLYVLIIAENTMGKSWDYAPWIPKCEGKREGLAVIVIVLAVVLAAMCFTRIAFKQRTINRYDVAQGSIVSHGYRESDMGGTRSYENTQMRCKSHRRASRTTSGRRSSCSDTDAIAMKPNLNYHSSGRHEHVVEDTQPGCNHDAMSGVISSSCCSSRNGTLRRNKHSHTALVNAGRKQSSSSLFSTGSGIISTPSGQFPPLPPIPGLEHDGTRRTSGSTTPIEGGTLRHGLKIRSESVSGSVRSYVSSKYDRSSIGRGSQRSRCGSSARVLAESYSRKAIKTRPRMPYDFVEGLGRGRRSQSEYERYPSTDRRSRRPNNPDAKTTPEDQEYWTVATTSGSKNDGNLPKEYRSNILYQGIKSECDIPEIEGSDETPNTKEVKRAEDVKPARTRVYDTVHIESSGEKLTSSDIYDSDDYDHLADCSSKNKFKTNSNDPSHRYERISYNDGHKIADPTDDLAGTSPAANVEDLDTSI